MDTETQKFIDQLKRISLTESERHVLRANLVSYTDFHPAPAAIPSPRGMRFFRPVWNMKQAFGVASFVLVVTLGTGTCFAAENSLPGDTLYPVKIGVNENIESALVFSPAQKAQVNAGLAERRLQEAAALATQQKLTPETSAALASNLDVHVTASENAAQTLQSSGDQSAALAARSDLESRLVANAQVIQLVVGAQSAPEQAQSAGFLSTALAAAQSASRARMDSEAAVIASAPPSPLAVDLSSGIALQQAVHDVDDSPENSTTSLVAQAQASITAAGQALAQAQQTQSASGATQAYILSQHAKRTAAETSIFLQATKALGINVGALADTTGKTPAKAAKVRSAAPMHPAPTAALMSAASSLSATSSESSSTVQTAGTPVSASPAATNAVSENSHESPGAGGGDVNWSAALQGTVDTTMNTDTQSQTQTAVPSLGGK